MCIFLYISFIFWTVSLIEGRGDAHVTPLVSMIDQTYLSPFILNHRSNETGPFRGTGLFYLYIGIKMTIVFYPRLDDLLLRFWLLQHVVSQARQTVHVNLINYEQCVWISFPSVILGYILLIQRYPYKTCVFIGQEARYLDSGCSVIAWVIYGYLFC